MSSHTSPKNLTCLLITKSYTSNWRRQDSTSCLSLQYTAAVYFCTDVCHRLKIKENHNLPKILTSERWPTCLKNSYFPNCIMDLGLCNASVCNILLQYTSVLMSIIGWRSEESNSAQEFSPKEVAYVFRESIILELN